MNLAQFSLILAVAVFSTIAASLPVTLRGKSVADGSPTAVGSDKKKALVVVFLSAVCPCSDSHLVELTNLKNEYPDFNFIGVHSNTDEAKEITTDYFKKAKLPFPVIQDTGAKIADEFKALKTPHAFVVLHSGEPAYQGGVSSSTRLDDAERRFLREALRDLRAGEKVETPTGRTLGCAISRGGKNVW